MAQVAIFVVTGPPCAGKTTHVREHRSPDDVVIDVDALAFAFGYPAEQIDWTLGHAARDLARGLRIEAVELVLRQPPAVDVWIVDTAPGPVARRYYRDAGARWVHLDPGLEVCLDRARAERSPATVEQVRAWYEAAAASTSHVGRRRSL